jgi:hypothetical protein
MSLSRNNFITSAEAGSLTSVIVVTLMGSSFAAEMPESISSVHIRRPDRRIKPPSRACLER